MLFDKEAIQLIKSKINSDGFIDLPAEGSSMFPLIQMGNICRFIPIKPSKIKKGDIVLFHSETGQLVAHRFCNKQVLRGNHLYYFKGDTNIGYDEPVSGECIIGKLIYIQKINKKHYINNFLSIFWGWIILSMPVSAFLQKYLCRLNRF